MKLNDGFIIGGVPRKSDADSLARTRDWPRSWFQMITHSSSSQRGARLLDPSRGAHFLEEAEGALNEHPIFLFVIAPTKAPVGKQIGASLCNDRCVLTEL
jgi:hypothetical protein